METRVDEIADGIYRLSLYIPEYVGPIGVTFNQFLIDGDEPLLFSTGMRASYPLMSEAALRVLPIQRLRWISSGHASRSDEFGAVHQWLAAAPRAEVVHGQMACMLQLEDMLDSPPRALNNGDVVDLGGKRVRYLDTPHVPGPWEAGVMYEETTGTLFCGDLFAQLGAVDPLTQADIVGPALAGQDMMHTAAVTPETGSTLRRLAELRPRTLAVMHGASFTGDCAAALCALADGFDTRLKAA